MRFGVQDFLFAAVVALGIAVAAVSPSLEAPYPAVIAAVYAVGAVAFLYSVVRVKFAGILRTVEQRLEEEKGAAAEHRAVTNRTFDELEKATASLRDQLAAAAERNRSELELVRRNVAEATAQFTRYWESAAAAFTEVKNRQDEILPRVQDRVAAVERAQREIEGLATRIRDDFNAYVADEQHFRETMENRLAERVSYLEDFIREKRKSLQI